MLGTRRPDTAPEIVEASYLLVMDKYGRNQLQTRAVNFRAQSYQLRHSIQSDQDCSTCRVNHSTLKEASM